MISTKLALVSCVSSSLGISNTQVDGHMMEVVAIDLQPVKPYTAQYVSLGIGELKIFLSTLRMHANEQ
jgi:hypothetical protein